MEALPDVVDMVDVSFDVFLPSGARVSCDTISPSIGVVGADTALAGASVSIEPLKTPRMPGLRRLVSFRETPKPSASVCCRCTADVD